MTTALVFLPTDCSGFIFTTPKPDKFWHQGRGVWLQAANRSIPSRSNGEITISLKIPAHTRHAQSHSPPPRSASCPPSLGAGRWIPPKDQDLGPCERYGAGREISLTKALARPALPGCKGFMVGKLVEAVYPVT